jgi:spermidine synthase
VAELVPAVIAWARGPLAHVFAGCLDDPRVDLQEADVNRLIQAGPERYDAILLDVDNGPEGLTRKGNDALYTKSGLNAARNALRPGGVLAVWSSGPDAAFTKRLRSAAFEVNEINIRATGKGRGVRHLIWMASKK